MLKDDEIIDLAYYLYKLYLKMEPKGENVATLSFKGLTFTIKVEEQK